MANVSLSRANAAHASRLTKTIVDLQARVKEQEDALDKLRTSSGPSLSPFLDPPSQVAQLHALRNAYQDLTSSEPYLPNTNSPILSLIALRITYRTIQESRECLWSLSEEEASLQEALKKEEDDLTDSSLISRAMGERIEHLNSEIEDQSKRSQDELGRVLLRRLEERKRLYEKGIKAMVKGFNKFVDETLGAMLAVEEMGGPVVGEMVEVDELTFEAGFSSQGKLKKSRPNGNALGDKRQQRIDDIWGHKDVEGAAERDEKVAAATEMRNLTENLMNAMAESESGAEAYVVLLRESAAARYLVRSKVAQLHSKDARRLRLVDFGRNLDD